MKKIVLMFAMLSLPAVATDIPYTNNSYNSTTCDSGVLQHDSGTVRLRARYEPNQVNIRWYNNNTELNPTNTAANTCDYDSALTLPANEPTRTGYTFAGWRVRPLIDFSTLGLSGGMERWGKGHFIGTSTPSCYHTLQGGNGITVSCNSDTIFTRMNLDEWQVRYDNNGKTLYGMGRCSRKPGNRFDYTWLQTDQSTIAQWQEQDINELDNYDGEDAASEAKYCWCKATGYRASDNAPLQGSISILAWVYSSNLYTANYCTEYCSVDCTEYAYKSSAYRDALFLPPDDAD